MNRKFKFSTGEFYHIYNRGTDKRLIFIDQYDWDRFNKLLYLCNSAKNIVFRDVPIGLTYVYDKGEPVVDIGAYCLMPNHFHILLHEKNEGGISIFMQKVTTAYTAYFNKKYGRSGSLFEGTFKAKHLDSDEYLKYIFSYIHLNPVKLIDPAWKENGITNRDESKEFLGRYKHSSYLDYIDESRVEKSILSKDSFPEYFGNLKDFEMVIDEWLLFNKDNTFT